MENRKELLLEITVPTKENKKDIDSFDYRAIAKQIFQFLENELEKWNIKIDAGLRKYFWDLIANSYDSYILRETTDPLMLKIVIQIIDEKLHIKFKDNGSGFKDKNKSEPFTLSEVKYADKTEKGKFFGGLKMGLFSLQHAIKTYGGSIQLKNRKSHGATVSLIFDWAQKETQNNHTLSLTNNG